MISAFRVGGRDVGPDEPPFVVAEMSGNHDGDLGRALAIVDAVADAGADALKLQSYTADSLTLDVDLPAFRVDAAHALWGGSRLHGLYGRAATPYAWHEPLLRRARERGLVAFSTPFDREALALLEDLDVPMHKVASPELVDLRLVEAVARTGKPLLLSTGMATLGEIDAAVRTARDAGCGPLVLMLCTSAYPAPPSELHLGGLQVLTDAFEVVVGFSDHSLGIGASLAAVALGASVLERHVALRRGGDGVDAAFSLEPAELTVLVQEARVVRQAVAPPQFGVRASEVPVAALRRSLYVASDVAAGDAVDERSVRSVRPAGGLPPSAWPQVRGRVFRHPARAGTPLSWDLI